MIITWVHSSAHHQVGALNTCNWEVAGFMDGILLREETEYMDKVLPNTSDHQQIGALNDHCQAVTLFDHHQVINTCNWEVAGVMDGILLREEAGYMDKVLLNTSDHMDKVHSNTSDHQAVNTCGWGGD